jgi:hypothetical protein
MSSTNPNPLENAEIQTVMSNYLNEYQRVMTFSTTLPIPSKEKELYSWYLMEAMHASDFRVASWMMHVGVVFPS